MLGKDGEPWVPWPKQHAFLLLDDKEVLFGGAAGGGKSDGGLYGGLQWVDHPSYAGLILRRTYQELAKPGALLHRSHQVLRHTDARFDKGTMTWYFPSGAALAFGYLRNDGDLDQYQSSEFQYIYLDELTEFSLYQYTFMLSRLRKLEGDPQPLRMRGGTNPGGRGHEWVKERWRLGKKYRELGLRPEPGRRFLPSFLEDNPSLDQAAYEEMLSELGQVLYRRLRKGDWDAAYSGTKFQRDWFEVIDYPPEVRNQVRYWDLAATEAKPGTDPDWTVGTLLGVTPHGEYVVLDVQRFRATPAETNRRVKAVAVADDADRPTPIYIEQEPGSSGKRDIDNWKRNILAGHEFRGHKTTGSKELRANPVSSMAEPPAGSSRGNIKLVRAGWVEAWLDEHEAFPTGEHDDQVDSMSGAFAKITTTREWGAY